MLHLSGVCRMPPIFFFKWHMTRFSEFAVIPSDVNLKRPPSLGTHPAHPSDPSKSPMWFRRQRVICMDHFHSAKVTSKLHVQYNGCRRNRLLWTTNHQKERIE